MAWPQNDAYREESIGGMQRIGTLRNTVVAVQMQFGKSGAVGALEPALQRGVYRFEKARIKHDPLCIDIGEAHLSLACKSHRWAASLS
ncbi:MAG: hypothetical protein ACKVOL_01185 [Novosphingobium sp.]